MKSCDIFEVYVQLLKYFPQYFSATLFDQTAESSVIILTENSI